MAWGANPSSASARCGGTRAACLVSCSPGGTVPRRWHPELCCSVLAAGRPFWGVGCGGDLALGFPPPPVALAQVPVLQESRWSRHLAGLHPGVNSPPLRLQGHPRQAGEAEVGAPQRSHEEHALHWGSPQGLMLSRRRGKRWRPVTPESASGRLPVGHGVSTLSRSFRLGPAAHGAGSDTQRTGRSRSV